jgi:hypothetical protein
MKISIIALAANLSACNDDELSMAPSDTGKKLYKIEGDLDTNKLLGTWQACSDIGEGLYVKTYYSFNIDSAITTLEDELYSDPKCFKLSEVESDLSLETMVSGYTIEEVSDELYLLNFETKGGNKFFTSLKLDGGELIEAKANPLGFEDGSSKDQRANYFADSYSFRKIY